MKNFLNRYPFEAVVGQEKLKRALILNLIDDTIGGILIVGEKGVSKSTIVRALENISLKRVITLPLNITEDALLGNIDIEKTITEGKMIKEKGLLQKAKDNILYIDEINLLEDRIVNLLLDSIDGHTYAEGKAYRQNEFILIGTMNKEEGELRSEFLDRFPMYIDIQSTKEEDLRVDILKRVAEYEKDKVKFILKYREKEKAIFEEILKAKEAVLKVKTDEAILEKIAKICLDYGVIGHRADIYMRKVAIGIAALSGRETVTEEDVLEAASYVLPHRLTRFPDEEKEDNEEKEKENDHSEEQEDSSENEEELEDSEKEDESNNSEKNNDKPEESREEEKEETESGKDRDDSSNSNNSQGSEETKTFEIGDELKLKEFLLNKDKKKRKGGGKRISSNSKDNRGRYVGSSNKVIGNDIALLDTIRYAAPYQKSREKNGMAIKIIKEDIRGKVRKRKSSSFIVFIVDSSGSLGVNKRMIEVKGAILSILKESYVKRDYVSLVLARGQEAEVVLPKTNSVERGYKLLKEIKTGGKTPLNSALVKGLELIKKELRNDDSIKPILVVISDGKGNVAMNRNMRPKEEMLMIGKEIEKNKEIKTIVLDVEKKGMLSFNLAKTLSETMNGEYLHIENLKKDDILGSVNKIKE
ncbi:MAG: VWA domain-containing protein [Clostridium sp.]|uniref:VWA domain-containing protein n=1 Tax=Clostridium sp. TaxID=1506 RepID=UPI003F373CFA